MQEIHLMLGNSSYVIKVAVAKSFFDRMMGLMFIKSRDKALLLLSCNSIHTFFMKFPIDAIFIDKNNRVVSIQRNIKPFRILLPVLSASKVLEIPSKLIQTHGLKPGDPLNFPEL